MNIYKLMAVALMPGVFLFANVAAEPMCASAEQAQLVRDFYAKKPGASPVVAARQLKLPEALLGSGLPADQFAATDGKGFDQVWAALTTWEKAIVIITKGADVFEVFSPISAGETSSEDTRFNLTHDNPLAGHLRPDLYASIYAYAIPGKKGAVTRGVFFYDQSGMSVFGVMMSGKGPPPAATEVAKFQELLNMIRSLTPVCP